MGKSKNTLEKLAEWQAIDNSALKHESITYWFILYSKFLERQKSIKY